MAKFMHQPYENFQKDVDKAAALFAAENETLLTPTWGKSWVDFALNKK